MDKIFTVVLAIVACLLIAVAYNSGVDEGREHDQKLYEFRMDSVDRVMDSLRHQNVIKDNRMQELDRQVYLFKTADSLKKKSYDSLSRKLTALKNRYNELIRIDTFTSDDIKRYFNENFKDSVP